jgi:hypothetical protein
MCRLLSTHTIFRETRICKYKFSVFNNSVSPDPNNNVEQCGGGKDDEFSSHQNMADAQVQLKNEITTMFSITICVRSVDGKNHHMQQQQQQRQR